MNITIKARDFARKKHEGQVRKDKRPFVVHPEAVAKKVAEYKIIERRDDIIAAAYLHDTLEDTDTTYYELVENFGCGVASLVLEVTSNDDMKRAIGNSRYYSYKLKQMTSHALLLKLCDRLDNMEDLELDHIDEPFRTRYVLDSKDIVDFLENNRKLSAPHLNLMKVLRTRVDYLYDKYANEMKRAEKKGRL